MTANCQRTSKISETDVHLQIASYFKKVGLGGCAVAFHIRNERPGDWQRINASKMGILPGLPDWCIIDGGRPGFLEIKPMGWKARRAKSGAYTPHELRQIETHNRLKRAGAWVVICETLDEVKAALTDHGVPLRAEAPIIAGLRASLAEAAE